MGQPWHWCVKAVRWRRLHDSDMMIPYFEDKFPQKKLGKPNELPKVYVPAMLLSSTVLLSASSQRLWCSSVFPQTTQIPACHPAECCAVAAHTHRL